MFFHMRRFMNGLVCLKQQLGPHLKDAESLTPPEGIPTGWEPLDQYLLWRGIPKGELSLFSGRPGTGATSLWIRTAKYVVAEKKWVAWVNSSSHLLPSTLLEHKIDLSRILVVQKFETRQEGAAHPLYRTLQELISSCLFETIGCHLNETLQSFPYHLLKKLKQLARVHKVALVFICHHSVPCQLNSLKQSLFALNLEFTAKDINVIRALHRPTPTQLKWRLQHADFVHQLTDIQSTLLR